MEQTTQAFNLNDEVNTINAAKKESDAKKQQKIIETSCQKIKDAAPSSTAWDSFLEKTITPLNLPFTVRIVDKKATPYPDPDNKTFPTGKPKQPELLPIPTIIHTDPQTSRSVCDEYPPMTEENIAYLYKKLADDASREFLIAVYHFSPQEKEEKQQPETAPKVKENLTPDNCLNLTKRKDTDFNLYLHFDVEKQKFLLFQGLVVQKQFSPEDTVDISADIVSGSIDEIKSTVVDLLLLIDEKSRGPFKKIHEATFSQDLDSLSGKIPKLSINIKNLMIKIDSFFEMTEIAAGIEKIFKIIQKINKSGIESLDNNEKEKLNQVGYIK